MTTEAIDKLVVGVDELCSAFGESRRIQDEGLAIMVEMLQILKRMQQNVEDLKVSIEAEESMGCETQESEPTVQLSTQLDSITENMKRVYVDVSKDSDKVENPMEIISVGVIDWDDTPSVCQNVSMDWVSYFAMLVHSVSIMNHILRQEKMVRLGKPPAKPPDYVLLPFGHFIDHLVQLEIVKKTTTDVGYLWNCMKMIYVQPAIISYDGVRVMVRDIASKNDPMAVAYIKKINGALEELGCHEDSLLVYSGTYVKIKGFVENHQPIYVAEPSLAGTVSILRGLKEKYNDRHGIRIQDTAVSSPLYVSGPLSLPLVTTIRHFLFEEISAACHGFYTNRCTSEGVSLAIYKASFGEESFSSLKLETTVCCLYSSSQSLKDFINQGIIYRALRLLSFAVHIREACVPTALNFDLRSANFYAHLNGSLTLSNSPAALLLPNSNSTSVVVKEYILFLFDIAKSVTLDVRFVPASKSDFVYVNAIEVFSAPDDLILENGAKSVGSVGVDDYQGITFRILETLHRVNVEGPKLTPFNDTLWRTWVNDDEIIEDSVLQLSARYITVSIPAQLEDVLLFLPQAKKIPDLYLMAITIYIIPNILAALLLIFPMLRCWIENSDWHIIRLRLWWSQPRVYIGRGMHESQFQLIKYTVFWLLPLSFGAEVADLVKGSFYFQVSKLSHLSKLACENDTACKTVEADCLHTMFLAMEDAKAVLIKLADRLHNMMTLDALPSAKQQRIAKETLEIFVTLANRPGISTWKVQIENMCFKHLNPDQHKDMSSKVEKSFDKEMVMSAVEKSKQTLKDTGLPYHDISGRHKSLFSIYSKMMKKKLNMNEIHDIHGLHLILEKEEDCYKALEVVHQLWPLFPGRFKDYIACPKYNEYGSLHNVVTGEGGVPNFNTWEIIADGYIWERRISEAISCLQNAFDAKGASSWKPHPALLTAFTNLCEEENDAASKEVLVEAAEPHSQLKLDPRMLQDSIVKIVNEQLGAFTLLVRSINGFLIFSLPRPPEVDDLEDKVHFKGGGMLHIGKYGDLRGSICISDIIS